MSGLHFAPLVFPAALVGLAVATGVVESTVPRIRLLAVPKLLVGAAVMSALALVLTVA